MSIRMFGLEFFASRLVLWNSAAGRGLRMVRLPDGFAVACAGWEAVVARRA